MKYKSQYKMVSSTDKHGKITQRLLMTQQGTTHAIRKWIMDTQEYQLRLALIGMGWTPPKGSDTDAQIEDPENAIGAEDKAE